MKLWITVDNTERQVEIERRDGLYAITIDGKTRLVDCRDAGSSDYLSLIIDNRSHLVECAPVRFEEGRYFASIDGRRYDVDVLDERLLASREASASVAATGPHVVTSPMPGLIVDVRVGIGDRVSAGSPVVIMEAMKMQNELLSEVDGVVTAVNVSVNDAVDSRTPLVEIERSE